MLLLLCGASLVVLAFARIQEMLEGFRLSNSMNLDSTESWNGTKAGHDSYDKLPPYFLIH